MAARHVRAKMMKKLSSSISELLSIPRKDGYDPSDENEGVSGLHKAAMMGNTQLLAALLSGTCNVDITDSKGMTSLHHAASLTNTETASILLKGGAHVDAICHQGNTPLHIACRNGMQDMVSLLLYYRAEPLVRNFVEKTPFDLACEFGRFKTVELLLDSGLSLEKVLASTATPSQIVASATSEEGRRRSFSSSKRRSVSSCTLSSALKTDASTSSLHLAARNGRLSVVVLLLECGWPVDWPAAESVERTTALMEAAVYGQLVVVRLLLHMGALCNVTNAAGQTALDLCKRRSVTANVSPDIMKEIRYLLKENDSFVYGLATQEFYGLHSDELNFNEGDYIWVIDRTDDKRWRGVIFGSKYNSRSGYFPSDCVEITDKPGRTMQRQASSTRQVKKVAVPSVPDVPGTGPGRVGGSSRHSTVSSSAYSSQGGDPLPPPIHHQQSQLAHSVSTPHQLQQHNGYVDVSQSSHYHQQYSSGPNNQAHYSSLSSSYAIMQQAAHNGAHYHHTTAVTQQQHLSQIVESPKHRNSTGSNSSQASSGFESMKSASAAHVTTCSSSSGVGGSTTSGVVNGVGRGESPPSRNSVHSSSTGTSSTSGSGSLGDSLDERLDDSTGGGGSVSARVNEMKLNGAQDDEILHAWLSSFGHEEYLPLLLTQGYDLATVVRMTPEDLTGVGIAKPGHRKRLTAEIHRLRVADNWPAHATGSIRDWLVCLRLAEYIPLFEQQGYTTMKQMMQLSWEDFEDIGINKLGHLKKLGLAIKKLKDHRHSGGCNSARVPPLDHDTITINAPPFNGRTTAEVKPYSHLPSSSVDTAGLSTFHQQNSPSHLLHRQHATPPPPQYHEQFAGAEHASAEHYGTFPRRSQLQQQQQPGQHHQHVVTAEVYYERPPVAPIRPRPVAKIAAKRNSGEVTAPAGGSYSKPCSPAFRQASCENLRYERTTALLDDSEDAADDGTAGGILSSPARAAGIRLNLHSPGRMLEKCRSAPPPPPPKRLGGANVPPPAPSSSSTRLPTLFSGLSPAPSLDTDEFPPPPSPIMCENSIRDLRTIMQEDISAATNGGGSVMNSSVHSSSGQLENNNANRTPPTAVVNGTAAVSGLSSRSSTSSCETLPFANENCGTIKSREAAAFVAFNATPSQQPAGPPHSARPSVRDVFAGKASVSLDATVCKSPPIAPAKPKPMLRTGASATATPPSGGGGGDSATPQKAAALDDIGSMLQNLTDELDALLWDPNKKHNTNSSTAAATTTSS